MSVYYGDKMEEKKISFSKEFESGICRALLAGLSYKEIMEALDLCVKTHICGLFEEGHIILGNVPTTPEEEEK